MSAPAGRQDRDRPPILPRSSPSIRVTPAVHQRLLTLQYERRMAGESVALSDIIGQLLEKAGTA